MRGGCVICILVCRDFLHERQAIMSTITVPVFYATTEGHTRRIAEQIASTLRQQGLDSEARDLSAALPPIDWLNIHGVVVGASIYAGRHQKAAEDFAKAEARHLAVRPSAFFSVSLSAGSRKPRKSRRHVRWRRASSKRRAGSRGGSRALLASSPTPATGSSSGRSCGLSPGARARRPMPAATMSSLTGLPCAGLRSRWPPTSFIAGARLTSAVRCDRGEFSAPPARFYPCDGGLFAFVGRTARHESCLSLQRGHRRCPAKIGRSSWIRGSIQRSKPYRCLPDRGLRRRARRWRRPAPAVHCR